MLNVLEPSVIESQLREVLGLGVLRKCGQESGFTIRERQITTARFATSLLKSLGARRVESIADLVRDFNFDHRTAVHYKPYYNRLDTPCFPRLMKMLFESLLRELALPALKAEKGGRLAIFNDVIIQDGSSFAVHEGLTTAFKGRFTTISPAAVELHATMSLFGDNMMRVVITGDAECERHYLPEPAQLLNKLFLADRGYDATEYMVDVVAERGSFIIRIRKSHDPMVKRIYRQGKRYRKFEGRRLSLVLKYMPKGKPLDMDVYWEDEEETEHRRHFRLVTLWNPGKKQWVRLMTNLERSQFARHHVFKIYRLRWQIELVFKELKSYANLHAFSTIKPHIVEGLIWASLCAAFLKRFITHACQHAMGGPAISTRKVAMCGHHIFNALFGSVLCGLRNLRDVLRGIYEFLDHNARRSNPRRERLRGRLATGLMPVGAAAVNV